MSSLRISSLRLPSFGGVGRGSIITKTAASLILISLWTINGSAQNDFFKGFKFSHRDSLLGGTRIERTCFDVKKYELTVKVRPTEQTIEGNNRISFVMRGECATLQIDLFENMHLDSVVWRRQSLKFERDAGAVFVQFPRNLRAGSRETMTAYFGGKPTVAQNAPWDGGFVWTTSASGKPWIGVACEGDGASLWFPNKDTFSDEPDSTIVHLITPSDLVGVSNGRKTGEKAIDTNWKQFDWLVTYPINNYNINISVGDYVNFKDVYTSETDKTKLDLDYWVMPENLAKAKKHFEQVKPMLAAYEYYFGKYPFWRDGYKLIETPYLGMEHQSGIAYGNKYMRGYMGKIVPDEFNFDFIIIHESGHEYFGNALTANDHGSLWLHEAFTTYMESLYLERLYGKDAALRYLQSQRKLIKNEEPIVGPSDVRYARSPDADMYYKGAWMLHSLRYALNDDALFFKALRQFYDDFKYDHTAARWDFFTTFRAVTDKDYYAPCVQYLDHPRIPVFVYSIVKKGGKLCLRYTYEANAYNFDLPINVGNATAPTRIQPTTAKVQEIELKDVKLADFWIDTDHLLVETRKEEKELVLPKVVKPKKK